MFRKFTVLALFSLAVGGWAAAARPDPDVTVKIMTQNMDDGTDQTYIIAALTGQIPDFSVADAVDLTFEELQASNFKERAGLIAAKIAEQKPDLVALQEATLWRFGRTPHSATKVLFDQLELLVSALDKLDVPYDVVAVNHLTDVALAGNKIGGALRFTDRNAVLVRSDLCRPRLHLSNVHSRTFDAEFPFFGLTITAGWISADVHVGNKHFRFVTTHLESPIPGVPEATDVQVAQAQELIDELRHTRMPIVICGDFNSDALHGGSVDNTPTVGLIEAAGYEETWPLIHPGGGDPGFTWPLYLEDQFPPLPFFAPTAPFERIDLFFSKDIEVVDVVHVTAPDPSVPERPFASDHSGVMATFHP
ncbi:MAG TPA: endonuclease/exonuclease/phosphatase family protein [Thermoanaerobaculia bacterium]|nr:endonuclease/exonuclease/phosphatase family protein [Thermoanaerobaculia bacterium]